MIQYLLIAHDTLYKGMMQSDIDDSDVSGVDFFVEVDGTAAYVSIINDDQVKHKTSSYVMNFNT